ncbi:thioredoxin family protein [Panacibacter ginsenosidivorans]|nr:thioredoxin family protein [Panacibacter ginsenosidivorans]
MKQHFLRYSLLVAGLVAVIVSFAFINANPENKTVTTEEKGIKFIEQDWNKAMEQARANKKLIFLDIYATWCGPCKMLKKNTFTDEAAGKFFNDNFINVSVDGEQGVGPELARKYGIEGYPSLIVTDANGNIVLQTEGYVDPSYLISFAKEALKRKS